jgi:CPA1 family monovalent cation:H+ antiporter
MTGLQARALIEGIRGQSVSELILSAALVSAVVILARFIWHFPATYLPRWLSRSIRKADPSPPWQWPFAIAFTGVRGIVSLAAALAIPFTTANGDPFPDRDLVLFLTFSVILVTLVGQGLMLPTVIRALGLAHAGRRERREDREAEHRARQQAIKAAIAELEKIAADRALSEEFVHPLRARHRERLRHVEHRIDGDDGHRKLTELHDEIELSLITAERQEINELFRAGTLKDETRRRIERELDLREAGLANQRATD